MTSFNEKRYLNIAVLATLAAAVLLWHPRAVPAARVSVDAEPWVPGFLDPRQLFDLRQACLVKGSLEPVVARLRRESIGAAGGGIPWDRVAP